MNSQKESIGDPGAHILASSASGCSLTGNEKNSLASTTNGVLEFSEQEMCGQSDERRSSFVGADITTAPNKPRKTRGGNERMRECVCESW